MHLPRVLLASLACAALAACDATAVSDGGTDAGPADGGLDAGACTTQAPQGGPEYVGQVSLTTSSSTGTTEFTISAAFWPDYGAAANSGSCAGTASGSCCFTPPAQAACAEPAQVSAGAVTIDDDDIELAQLDYSSGYASLDSLRDPAIQWAAGDTLRVSTGGGSLIAGSASVVAPVALTSVTPAFGSTLAIPKGSAWTVSWQPTTGAAGVSLTLQDAASNTLTCTAALAAGHLSVPAALLEQLGSSGSASITTVMAADAITGNSRVRVQASGPAESAQATYP